MYSFDFDGENDEAVQTPVKLYYSYFPNEKLSFYAMSEFFPSWNSEIMINSYFLQSGLGAKYAFSSRFQIELLATEFWLGKNSGRGTTFNLGLRYLTF